MGYLFLVIALILNAAANILMKLGSAQLPLGKQLPLAEVVILMATNVYLIFGILLFAANVIFYILSLSKINLSIAYPLMTAGGFMIITSFTFFYLKEPLNALQLIGLLLIIVGIMFVSINLR